MKDKIWKYMGQEVAIEYKACLYFFCILFFYCCNLLRQKLYAASILHLLEMIVTTYVIGYVQVYFLDNFDETERIGKREAAEIFIGTCVYAGVSWLFAWFERDLCVTMIFAGYMILGYVCVILANRAKRSMDTDHLNRMLKQYKGDVPGQQRREMASDGGKEDGKRN